MKGRLTQILGFAACSELTDMEETAEHVFFVCPRFADARRYMMTVSGLDSTLDNIVQKICQDHDIWCAVNTAAYQIEQGH